MAARSDITENNKKQPVSTAPAQGMFQPRPFVVQPQTEEQSQQPPDLKTALQRAERYGHRLDRIKSIKPPVPAQIPRIVQAKLTIGQPSETIANVVHRALDPEQEAKVEQIAKNWAATISKKNDQKLYNKDKIKYIKNKLKSGDLVEEVGSSRVQEKFDASEAKVNVWSNMRLEFQDTNGNSVGGEQAELDFFIFKEGGGDLPARAEVVSAKLDGQKVKPSQDRRLLSHYYELNITGTEQELIDDLKARFGGSPKYEQARRVVVRYVDNADGSQGLLPLEEFRRRVPRPLGNSNVTVYGIAPDDTIKGKQNFIPLGIDQKDLLDGVIEIIDRNINIDSNINI